MNYDLAKQLKDAGFPQRDNGYQIIQTYPKNRVEPHYPTLSELIEACGDGFDMLCKSEDGWWSQTKNGIEGKGDTPEEAVAKLWLELNKK